MKLILTLMAVFTVYFSQAQCNLDIGWTFIISGGNITFINESTGVPPNPQFAWLYDGQSSSLENPTFPYDSTISEVCFAIYSQSVICEDSICGPLDNPACNLNISWTSSINGGNITFTNTSTGTPTNAAYAWLYDGQGSSQENPTFLYNAAVSEVCFAITDIDNTNCQDSICGPIGSPPCTLNLSWTSCVGAGTIGFNNTSTGMPTNASFAWLYNGQSSSQEHPTFTWDSSATTVCFAVYDIDNPACQDSICGPINDTCSCNLNISWYSIVDGNNITFYNTSTGTPTNAAFAWLYDGQGSNLENPTFPYNAAVSDVCFAITDINNTNCQDSICGPVNIDSTGCNLVVDYISNISGNDINFYSISTGVPPGATYWWDYGSNWSTDQNPTFIYDPGVTFVCLTIMDSTGLCSDTLCGPMNFDSSATVIEYTELDVEVYPNPFNGELNIVVNENNSILDVLITDLSGRIVFNEQMLGKKEIIDLGHLDAGGYLLFITNPNYPENRTVRKILRQ